MGQTAEQLAYARSWYSDNREAVLLRNKRDRLRNPAKYKTAGLKAAAKQRQWSREYKAMVVAHYGGKCVCCGDDHFKFMTIEHLNNDGAEQRRTKHPKQGYLWWKWIVDNGYPDDLTVMCFNCNHAKGVYGRCPHEDE